MLKFTKNILATTQVDEGFVLAPGACCCCTCSCCVGLSIQMEGKASLE